jgi:hypothetical protein
VLLCQWVGSVMFSFGGHLNLMLNRWLLNGGLISGI